MSDKKTPKQVFLDEILKTIKKFEDQTGVEVHDICFPNRINATDFELRYLETIISTIELTLK